MSRLAGSAAAVEEFVNGLELPGASYFEDAYCGWSCGHTRDPERR